MLYINTEDKTMATEIKNTRGVVIHTINNEDLRGANLIGANLRGAVGNMAEVKSMQVDRYYVSWTADRLQIGCKNYKIADWFDFCDDAIANMDRGALDWWKKYRDFIRMAIDLSPATPTGHENA